MAANVYGASFAIAVVLLSFGRVAMLTTRIFNNRRVKEAREEARREEQELAIRADKERLPGESLVEAMERLRESQHA